MGSTYNIELKGVSKIYTTSKVSPVKNIIKILKGTQAEITSESFIALDKFDLTINDGERVGIVGHNGAGKTTLLNLIGGFISADTGEVIINGKVNAIMSIGVGVREELTGIENIYVNGELHGKTPEEVELVVPEIIEFTDIGEYIDKPVKTYSSGMKARLAFAMLSFIEPEILIIDEALGVGDKDFASKSVKKIEQLCQKGKILIVVSHSMGSINTLTNRTIWLNKGKVMMDGPSKVVTQAYLDFVNKRKEAELLEKFNERIKNTSQTGVVTISDIKLFNESSLAEPKIFFNVRENLFVKLSLKVSHDVDDLELQASLIKMDGTLLTLNVSSKDGLAAKGLKANKNYDFKLSFGTILFSEGVYELKCDALSNNILQSSLITIIKIENTTEKYISKPDYFCDFKITAN